MGKMARTGASSLRILFIETIVQNLQTGDFLVDIHLGINNCPGKDDALITPGGDGRANHHG
jgi:hypothetical protein